MKAFKIICFLFVACITLATGYNSENVMIYIMIGLATCVSLAILMDSDKNFDEKLDEIGNCISILTSWKTLLALALVIGYFSK